MIVFKVLAVRPSRALASPLQASALSAIDTICDTVLLICEAALLRKPLICMAALLQARQTTP